MTRFVLLDALLFLLPFIAFGLWLRFGQPDPTAPKSWRDAPLFWLFVVALVLAIAGVFAMADFSGGREGVYVPPHEENGRVVPGHFAPGGS
jgi:hypothetical protein